VTFFTPLSVAIRLDVKALRPHCDYNAILSLRISTSSKKLSSIVLALTGDRERLDEPEGADQEAVDAAIENVGGGQA
jgi:hypothetical protein